MDSFLWACAQLILFFVGIKLWFAARRWRNAGETRWRRRFGLLLFFAPVWLWLAQRLLPSPLDQGAAQLAFLDESLREELDRNAETTRQALPMVWAFLAKPLVYTVFYTCLGILAGWPLDRLTQGDSEEEVDCESPD